MVLWDEPNIELECQERFWPQTASITMEVKDNYCHVTMQYILNKTSEIKFSVDRVYGLAIMNILPRSTTSKNIDKIHTTMYISWWFRFCWKILSSSTATLNLTQTLEKRALSAITLIGVRVWTNIYFEKINHLSINYPVSNAVHTFMPVCQYSLISFVLLHIWSHYVGVFRVCV